MMVEELVPTVEECSVGHAHTISRVCVAVTATVSEHMAKTFCKTKVIVYKILSPSFHKYTVTICWIPLAQLSNSGVLPLSSLSPACSLSSPPRTTHICSLCPLHES
eukprot:COSAG02_NODE_1203_length_13900_cov_11.040287_9_plen_106_part_00